MAGFSIRNSLRKLIGLEPLITISGTVESNDKPQGAGSTTVDLNDVGREDYKTAVALTALFTEGVNSRREFLKDYEGVRHFYIVDAMLNMIAEDSLAPDATTEDILTLSSENSEIDKELQELQKRIDLDGLVNDIILDLEAFGEYSLRLNVQPKLGVVEIIDDVVQGNMVVFYRRGMPYLFMQKIKDKFTVSKPVEFAHFVLGNRKLRINLGKEFEQSAYKSKLVLPDGLPTYVRIGRSLLFGVLSKIKELQLLESLIPAEKINQITKGNIVGVEVPPSTTPEDAFKIVRKYENLLNKKQGINPIEDEISVANILQAAGRTKVIPLFGEKGNLQSIDARDNRNVDDLLSTVQDTREVILSSIGIPPELLFGGDGPKSEILKKYARYIRKLKYIQTAVSRGIKQIVFAHISNLEKPLRASHEDIKVNFRNVLINIDELDKLEFSVALIESVKQMNEFVLELQDSETLQDVINIDAYKIFLKRQLNFINQGVDFVKDGDADDDGAEVDFPSGADDDDEPDEKSKDDASDKNGKEESVNE